MQQNKIHPQFLQHLKPYKGSIILAMFCALLANICYIGPLQILADTLDSLKRLEGFNQSTQPVQLLFFEIDNIYEGYEITLTNAEDALSFFLRLFAVFLCLVLAKGIFVYFSDYVMERVSNKFSFRMRNDLYENIVSAPLGTLSKHRSGDVMTRVTDDVRMLQQAVTATAVIMRSVITVIVFGSMLFYKNFQMTILSMLIFPFVAYFISNIGKRVRNASTDIQQRSSDIYSQLKETLTGINIIKSFTSEENEMERFRSITTGQYNSAIRRARFASLLPPLIEWIGAIGIAIILVMGCWNVIEGRLTIGWFTAYAAMVGLMYKPIKIIGTLNNVLQQSMASAERIFNLSDISTEKESVSEGDTELTNIQGAVEFQNVSFAYQQTPVIINVNFKTDPGQVIALVGPSGSGKSTLLNLLLRFYTVDSGSIIIDNVSIDEVTLKSLRQNIALVPQDTFLFDGTVLENIEYGSPGSNRQEIVDAARKANAHSFITKLPKGYDTQIGEAGGTLSGGEQQRLSIARAILKNAPILVLDEATSALDTQSEAVIQESLTNLMKGRTCFIIAHRLTTVMRADNILVISDGEIVESGNHTDLFQKNGLYRKMCEQQMFE
ncbi:MAG: ABC transporter ATP-binding protein [Candidatus Poribacteria bacterium]|nr:ABC transporter ATP-binding protein [Candidatus Poribacteria bacterium]